MVTTPIDSLKQPAGLRILFFAELWERFGFYSIQALLVLYLVKVFLFTDTQAYSLFSAYSALIYATPVLGGYIADRYIGFRWAIFLGATLYVLGYAGLATQHHTLFYPALGFLIAGNGFFKSSVSSLLGTLYEHNDPRRDSGFTIFYMGINIGILLAPIVCTYLAMTYGWGYGFGIAGITMLINIAICAYGFRALGAHGLKPVQTPFNRVSATSGLYVAIVACVVGLGLLVKHSTTIDLLLTVFGIIVCVALVLIALREDKIRRNNLFVLIILMLFSIVFWAFYMQMFLSITLFIERNVDRHLFNDVVHTGMFPSVQAFFIIVLAPLFAKLWLKLSNTRFNPSTTLKFAIALFCVGISLWCLSLGTHVANAAGLISMGWIVLCYFLIACGELSLSPVGLSCVTALSPPRFVGMIMGIWFLCLATSYALAGHIADLTAIPKTITDPHITGALYGHLFAQFGHVCIGVGILLALLNPTLTRLSRSS